MPGNLKEVRNRIKSVMNTQQITKAMKMVSAAKLRRAQERILQMRPYSQKLQEMLSNIVSSGDVNISLAEERDVKNVLIVLITSDRGLAGAFNMNSVKLARKHIAEKYPNQATAKNITVLPLGKKGFDAIRKFVTKVDDRSVNIFATPTFDAVSAVSQFLMDEYKSGRYDAIDIVYSQFKNAATQIFTVEQFLPVPRSSNNGDVSTKAKADFIFEPNKEEILEYLVPKILNTQLFKAVLDSNASEHGARMTAMDKASDNANELLKDLRIQYNRQRQAAITTELTEIVSGANALAGV
jgi:F-type H+-transporting ATPase subunit gamma